MGCWTDNVGLLDGELIDIGCEMWEGQDGVVYATACGVLSPPTRGWRGTTATEFNVVKEVEAGDR